LLGLMQRVGVQVVPHVAADPRRAPVAELLAGGQGVRPERDGVVTWARLRAGPVALADLAHVIGADRHLADAVVAVGLGHRRGLPRVELAVVVGVHVHRPSAGARLLLVLVAIEVAVVVDRPGEAGRLRTGRRWWRGRGIERGRHRAGLRHGHLAGAGPRAALAGPAGERRAG